MTNTYRKNRYLFAREGNGEWKTCQRRKTRCANRSMICNLNKADCHDIFYYGKESIYHKNEVSNIWDLE